MTERRRELGIRSIRRAAALAGLSEATWRQMETGRRQLTADVVVPASPTAVTKAAACKALGWTDDSIDRILAGGEPVELDGKVPESSNQHGLADLVTRLRELAEEARRFLEEEGRQGRASP